MYISKIRLNNIRCFGTDFIINLDRNSESVLWASILGNNASGKTTLLRSIAIGLCDESSAAGLLKESEQGYIRRGKSKATINLTFKDERNPDDEFTIMTSITKTSPQGGLTFERLRQETKPSIFPWSRLFVCAYGTGRGISGTGDISGYSVINAMYNLFNYSEGLQNPELAFRRMEQNRQNNLRSSLKKVLDLGGRGTIGLTDSGFVVSGLWGTRMPLRDLADGYKSTFHWITDLWGWAVSYDRNIKSSSDISGIVMIDELEQHLHPTWQRYVISRLRSEFPHVQFIVTTHSPLVALGTADIDNANMITLKLKEHNIVEPLEEEASIYKGMRVDQILTSIFELPIARSGDTGDKIIRFQELFIKDDLNKDEQEELDKLRESVIRELPDVTANMEDLKVHKKIQNSLIELKENSESSSGK